MRCPYWKDCYYYVTMGKCTNGKYEECQLVAFDMIGESKALKNKHGKRAIWVR